MTIEITSLGFFLIPIAILIVFRPTFIPAALIALSMFQAGAVILIVRGGSYFGVAPQYFAILLGLPILAFILRLGGFGEKESWRISSPFILMAIYGLVGAVVLPRLFRDRVMVYTPRLGMDIAHPVLLQPGSTNLAQAFYLCTLCFGFWLTVRFVARIAPGQALRRATWALILAGVAAAFIGFYQVIALRTGLPNPTALFNSNLGYAQGYNQHLAGVTRLSSTFSEPSEAAAFLSASFASALYLFVGGVRRWLSLGATALLFLALVLTTSTTAYATVFVVTAAIMAKVLSGRRLSWRLIFAAMAIAALLCGVVVVYAVNHPAEVARVWTSAVSGKTESNSFRDREASNWNAIELGVQTWGLGVGVGSTRASSLVATIFGNLGLLGLLFPLWWYTRFRQLRNRAVKSLPHTDRNYLLALGWGMFAFFIAGALAVPDFEQVPLWIGTAVLCGVGARMQAAGIQQVRYMGGAA